MPKKKKPQPQKSETGLEVSICLALAVIFIAALLVRGWMEINTVAQLRDDNKVLTAANHQLWDEVDKLKAEKVETLPAAGPQHIFLHDDPPKERSADSLNLAEAVRHGDHRRDNIETDKAAVHAEEARTPDDAGEEGQCPVCSK